MCIRDRYRGAWAEWEIENIEMAVPISPEELRAKRNSISVSYTHLDVYKRQLYARYHYSPGCFTAGLCGAAYRYCFRFQ